MRLPRGGFRCRNAQIDSVEPRARLLSTVAFRRANYARLRPILPHPTTARPMGLPLSLDRFMGITLF